MRRVLFIIAALIVALPVAGYFFRETLIKSAINNIGTAALGTEVSVTKVVFEPFDGLVALEGLKVANPEGYSANNAIEVTQIRVQLNTQSLLGGAIQIKEITVQEPKIRMEGGLKKNNLTALQENLPQAASAEQKAAPAVEEEGETRPVEIDLLQITDGVITITKPFEVTANLGTITLKDIGKEGSQTSLADLFPLIMNRIINVGTSVLSSELAQKGIGALEKVGDDASGVVKSLGSKLKGLFGN